MSEPQLETIYIFTPEGWKRYEAYDNDKGLISRPKPNFVVVAHTGSLYLNSADGTKITASTWYRETR